MKVTESQLRSIIKKTISEAISQTDYNNAQNFMSAKYSRDHANPTNLFQMIKQAVVSKKGKDIEGNLDILDSANQIYPLIQMFNAEIKKLNSVYRYFSKRADGNYVAPQKTARTPMDAARKQKMLATRAANKQERDRIMAQYGNIDNPDYVYMGKSGVNPALAQKGLNNMKSKRSNPNQMAGSGWIGGMNESIFGGNANAVDEIDSIVANYRKCTPEQMKAAMPKIQARIQDYQNIVQNLQGKLDKWTGADGSAATIYDRNAQARAERDAALKNVGKRNPALRQAVNESIDNAVSKAIKKILK